MRYLKLTAIVFSLFIGVAYATVEGSFIIPEIPDGEETSFKVSVSNKKENPFSLDNELSELHEFTYRIFREEENGKKYYRVDETERFGRGMSTDFSTLFELTDSMKMMSYTKSVKSFTGKVVRKEFSDFDDPAFNFPKHTVLLHVITFWLRGVNFKVGAVHSFHLLMSDNSKPWRMHARVVGVEEVSVPAGKFKCYKVSLEPDLKSILGKWSWVGPAIQSMIPEFYMWYSCAPGHHLVKFVGTLGPKGITPTQTHELVSVRVP